MKKKVIVFEVDIEDVVKYLISKECNACIEFVSWSNGQFLFEVVDVNNKIKTADFIKDSSRLNFSDDHPKMTNVFHLDFRSLIYNVLANPDKYKSLFSI